MMKVSAIMLVWATAVVLFPQPSALTREPLLPLVMKVLSSYGICPISDSTTKNKQQIHKNASCRKANTKAKAKTRNRQPVGSHEHKDSQPQTFLSCWYGLVVQSQ